MSIIGLTGGIGSGKTFVSKIFNSNDVFVIFDSDLCAKQIMENNIDVIEMVKEKIGKKSYEDGLIQTKYISDIIFNDKEKLNELNKNFSLKDLSIGMSSDYIKAVENDATYLRVGSAIFGNRT